MTLLEFLTVVGLLIGSIIGGRVGFAFGWGAAFGGVLLGGVVGVIVGAVLGHAWIFLSPLEAQNERETSPPPEQEPSGDDN